MSMHITHINLCILLYREIHQVKQKWVWKKKQKKKKTKKKNKTKQKTSGHLKMKNNYCIAIVSGGERWKNGMEGFDKK